MNYKKVFDEIPSNTFHSCILTTFSFDFHFMEEKIRRQLHSKGVSNIIVLMDETMLQKSLGKLTGHLKNLGNDYSVVSAKEHRLFHPKINLFVGESKALILIGSGNLTASGHGKNHEIWSATYVNGLSDPNLSFFYEVFSYLEQFFHDGSFIENQKRWITENCKLFSKTNFSSKIWYSSDKFEYRFIANDLIGNIWQKLTTTLIAENIKEINIVAPYFDEKGVLLTHFLEKFIEAKISVVLQPNSCLPPLKMQSHPRLKFFKWEESVSNEMLIKKQVQRQHAKIFQFYSDKKEFLLIGSANPSVAAFGLNDKIFKNEEAGLLLVRSKQNWLSELGIEISGESFLLSEEVFPLAAELETAEKEISTYEVRIIGVEKRDFQIKIQLNDKPPSDFKIFIFDGWGNNLDLKYKISKIERNKIEFSFSFSPKNDSIQFLQLFKNGIAISNKGIILDINQIYKTHPSKPNQELNRLLNNLGNSENHTLDLIDYFHTLHQRKEVKDGSPSMQIKVSGSDIIKEEKEISYVALTYEEYNQKYGSDLSGMLSSENLKNFNAIRILEAIFNAEMYENLQKTNKIADEEELENVDKSFGKTDEIMFPVFMMSSQSSAQKRKNKLRNLFINYWESLAKKVQKKESPPASIVDFAMYLIHLYLLLDTYDKVIKIKEKEIGGFLKKNGNEWDWDNFRIIALDLMGIFTLYIIRSSTFNSDENDYLKNKMLLYKRKAQNYNTLCLYLIYKNQKRKSDFEELIFPLYCNIRENFILKDTKNQLKEIKITVDQFQLNDFSESHFNSFLGKCEKKFAKIAQKNQESKLNSVFFDEKFGWVFIKEIHKKNKELIYLIRPGFYYNFKEANSKDINWCFFETGAYFKLNEKRFINRTKGLFSNVFFAPK